MTDLNFNGLLESNFDRIVETLINCSNGWFKMENIFVDYHSMSDKEVEALKQFLDENGGDMLVDSVEKAHIVVVSKNVDAQYKEKLSGKAVQCALIVDSFDEVFGYLGTLQYIPWNSDDIRPNKDMFLIKTSGKTKPNVPVSAPEPINPRAQLSIIAEGSIENSSLSTPPRESKTSEDKKSSEEILQELIDEENAETAKKEKEAEKQPLSPTPDAAAESPAPDAAAESPDAAAESPAVGDTGEDGGVADSVEYRYTIEECYEERNYPYPSMDTNNISKYFVLRLEFRDESGRPLEGVPPQPGDEYFPSSTLPELDPYATVDYDDCNADGADQSSHEEAREEGAAEERVLTSDDCYERMTQEAPTAHNKARVYYVLRKEFMDSAGISLPNVPAPPAAEMFPEAMVAQRNDGSDSEADDEREDGYSVSHNDGIVNQTTYTHHHSGDDNHGFSVTYVQTDDIIDSPYVEEEEYVPDYSVSSCSDGDAENLNSDCSVNRITHEYPPFRDDNRSFSVTYVQTDDIIDSPYVEEEEYVPPDSSSSECD